VLPRSLERLPLVLNRLVSSAADVKRSGPVAAVLTLLGPVTVFPLKRDRVDRLRVL
jgi:hypothetical protein